MPELRIIYDVDGWAFCHAAHALCKHAPPDFHVTCAPLKCEDGSVDLDTALGPREPGIVFVMHTRPALPALVHSEIRARGWTPALVGAWNSGWPLNTELLPERHQQVDALLINNSIAWEHLRHLPRIHLCPNGVDLDVFRLSRPIAGRPPRALWCGSRYWQNVKGYENLIRPLESRLTALGIPCDFRLVDSLGPGKLPPPAMADWYNTGTVFLCASLTEGTPNTALEAAACGCTVVSTPVGNMPELIESGRNGFLVDRSVDALEAGVLRAVAAHHELAVCMQSTIRDWGWQHRAPAFFAAFRQAAELRLPPHELDLRMPAVSRS